MTETIKKASDFRIEDVDACFKQSEYAREHWCVTAAHGVTVKDLLEPSVWANVARKLRPWSIIEVRAEDGTYFAWLVVLAAERTWAKVEVLLEKKLSTKDVAQTQESGVKGYHYMWKGAKLQHCIVRDSDGAVIHEQAKSKADALFWLNERKTELTA